MCLALLLFLFKLLNFNKQPNCLLEQPIIRLKGILHFFRPLQQMWIIRACSRLRTSRKGKPKFRIRPPYTPVVTPYPNCSSMTPNSPSARPTGLSTASGTCFQPARFQAAQTTKKIRFYVAPCATKYGAKTKHL
jgi:hypothetical protein